MENNILSCSSFVLSLSVLCLALYHWYQSRSLAMAPETRSSDVPETRRFDALSAMDASLPLPLLWFMVVPPVLFLLVLCAPFLPYAQRSTIAIAEVRALASFGLNLQDPLGALDGWDCSWIDLPPGDCYDYIFVGGRTDDCFAIAALQASFMPSLHSPTSQDLHVHSLTAKSDSINNVDGSMPFADVGDDENLHVTVRKSNASVAVTATPAVMVESFARSFLGDSKARKVAVLVESFARSFLGGSKARKVAVLVESFARSLAEVLGTENEEPCTSYDMLKVARNLYRWTKDVLYADYYERQLTNGVLSIQRGTEPGVMIYFLPQGRGVSKSRSVHGWGTQFDSFWCYYGTGTESFSKLGDSIYFEEVAINPTLYVAQYISSTFNWNAANVALNQTVTPYSSTDTFLRLTFTFTPLRQGPVPSSTLNLRIPTWTHVDGSGSALLKGKPLNQQVNGGSYLSMTRKWSAGDVLTLNSPNTLRSEHVKDNLPQSSCVHAILYGPFLLVGHTILDQWDLKVGQNKEPEDYMTAIPATSNSHLFTFAQDMNKPSRFVLRNMNLGANMSLTMEKIAEAGTINATESTYRLVLLDEGPFTSLADVMNKRVAIEPVHLPGQRLAHQRPEKTFVVGSSGFFMPISWPKPKNLSLDY